MSRFRRCYGNKTLILPSCSLVHIIEWLHLLDLGKTLRENARWKLHRDSEDCFEQIIETPSNRTTAIRPPTTVSRTIQERRRHVSNCWRSKDELVCDILRWTLTHGHTIHQHRCRLEDLARAMADREGWKERVKEICAENIH